MSDQLELIKSLEGRIAELERERRPRHVGRLPRLRASRRLLVVALGLALLIPGAVLASHRFSDVPDGHQFHTNIGAIVDAGVTAGCTTTTYCPNNAVTRGQMAAFMHRGFGRVGMAVNGATDTPSLSVNAGSTTGANVPVRTLNMIAPGASSTFNPNQFVHLQGRLQIFDSTSATKGCPCEFALFIRDETGLTNGPTIFHAVFQSSTAFLHAIDVEAVFPALPGARQYKLYARVNWRESTTNAAAFGLWTTTSLVATTYPFGSTGANTLSAEHFNLQTENPRGNSN